jgi:hypothetical protein
MPKSRNRAADQLRGDRMTSRVDAPSPASLVAYQVGDRVWAMHRDDTRLISLVEVVEVGRARVTRGKAVYDEDDVPSPEPMEGMSGYAAGVVATHERTCRVRVLHTQSAFGHSGHPGAAVYPALAV